MTTSDFVNAVILKATGKPTLLTTSDSKWAKILAIGNRYISQWQNERGVDWNSLYDPEYSLGTVSASKSYELDDEIHKLSDARDDYVYIYRAGETTSPIRYQTVSADRLKNYYGNYCAQIGRNLVFNKTFTTSDAEYGGSITVPVYLYADPLVGLSDDVPVDDPEWLVVITAAEYVRNDITKQNQYPNLIGEANEIMARMIDDNDGQVSEVTRDFQADGATW